MSSIIEAVQAAYTSWSAQAVRETVEDAEKLVECHGSIDKARAAISDLAYGNVSLSCRAHFRPIDNVLGVMCAHNQGTKP